MRIKPGSGLIYDCKPGYMEASQEGVHLLWESYKNGYFVWDCFMKAFMECLGAEADIHSDRGWVYAEDEYDQQHPNDQPGLMYDKNLFIDVREYENWYFDARD